MSLLSGKTSTLPKVLRYDDSILLLQNIHYPYGALAERVALDDIVFVEPPEPFRLCGYPVRFLSLKD